MNIIENFISNCDIISFDFLYELNKLDYIYKVKIKDYYISHPRYYINFS